MLLRIVFHSDSVALANTIASLKSIATLWNCLDNGNPMANILDKTKSDMINSPCKIEFFKLFV